jgi:tetratricopeptide (TPR) repeat protein
LKWGLSNCTIQNGCETACQDEFLQNYTGTTLNNLGALLWTMGRIEEAKNRYEKALEMREKLLENDPENVTYQSYVGTTLNNLGALLKNMGRIEEAKNRYEKALEIYTEPMQYLTIGKKAESIIRLIELSSEQAEKETNSHRQIKYLEESYQLCKKNQEFFNKYELKHEKKLVMEAGLSAYVDCVIKDIREEKDSKKRAEGTKKRLKPLKNWEKSGTMKKLQKWLLLQFVILKEGNWQTKPLLQISRIWN